MYWKKLEELRINNNLTKREVAKKFNVAESTYGKWELGKRKPDLETITSLADLFGVSVDYLLEKTNDPTPPNAKKEASDSKTPSEAAIEYFVSENGREPTLDELKSFLAVAKGLFSTLPDKTD